MKMALSPVEVYESTVIPRPVEEVWNAVRKFGALNKYVAAASSVTLSTEGADTTVGVVRDIAIGDKHVYETLLALDDVNHVLTYNILPYTDNAGVSPFPGKLVNYRATQKLHHISSTGETFMQWYATFLSDNPTETKSFVEGVFKAGFEGLA